MAARLPYAAIVALYLGSLLASGCDDAFIDPFENDDKYYTIYGFLDEAKNFQDGIHSVRVIPVTRHPERIGTPASPQASIDGRVFLTDLNDALTVEMTHTLQEFEPGVYGHIFSVRQFILPNHRYRIEIIRSDEITTYAETRLPNPSSSTVERGPLQASPDSSIITQDLLLTGIESIWSIDMIYYTSGGTCFTPTRNVVSYGRAGRPAEGGWALEQNISMDRNELAERFGTPNFSICEMGIFAKVLDDKWVLPEGEIDEDAFSLPENLTNVVNGYGYFGSMAIFQYNWLPDTELSALLEGTEAQ